MNNLPDQAIERIVAALAEDSGRAFARESVRTIARPEGKSEVADATLALLIDGRQRADDAVILISPAAYPEVVAEAVAKIDEMAQHLSQPTIARALRPIAEGRLDGASYAAFTRLRPLPEGGIAGRIEARLVAPAARDWLIAVARDSRRPVDDAAREALFRRPLETLAGDADLPPDLKAAARTCLDRIGGEDLFTIVGHGDFWVGNLLFPRGRPGVLSAIRGDFRVIDWRGARSRGYPFADLARFCLSIRRPSAAASGQALETYRQALGIAPEAVGIYALASMGRGGMELDQFPRPRYLALAGRLYDFFRIHGYFK